MNSPDAVRSFALAGNMQIGGSLSAAIGPVGTGGAVNAAIAHPAPMFSYSRSKGLFAGMSLEGTLLVERKDANRDFYGQPIPAADLLSGKVPAPEAASALYEVVEAAEAIDESGVPQQAYVPGMSGPQQGPTMGGAPASQGNTQGSGSTGAYDLGGSQAGGGVSGEKAAAKGGSGEQGKSTDSKTVFDAGNV